ncbi:MAG: phosphatidate cytidylyltransferase, partial [bacterium]
HRLAPAISPGKSVEGFLAGMAAAVGVAVAFAAAVGWPAVHLGFVGLGVGLAAVAGDLWESALKRAAGVKDSGTLLPGHGGVLDRFDAVLFGVPVGYYMWGWLL